MATPIRLKVLFRRKNNNKVVSFSALFFMFTLTWTTEKELERVIGRFYTRGRIIRPDA